MRHQDLQDAGLLPHAAVDGRLPSDRAAKFLQDLEATAPAAVTGARDDPEAALANLLTALASLGLITDTTTAS